MAKTPTQNQYGICGKCCVFLRPIEKEDTELECWQCGMRYPAPPKLWWSVGSLDEPDLSRDTRPREELPDVAHW
jgi:hypothetical protein